MKCKKNWRTRFHSSDLSHNVDGFLCLCDKGCIRSDHLGQPINCHPKLNLSFTATWWKSLMIGYGIEYFSFLFIAVLFSAGNAKKNVFTVFTVPTVTIDGFNRLKLDTKIVALISQEIFVQFLSVSCCFYLLVLPLTKR